MNFYSQYGEDYILYEFFCGKLKGTAIDIGAMEGIRFSNSYIFSSQLDWNVVCIEPHAYYYDLLLKNRTESNCIKLNAAISSSENENRIFFANFRGSLSSLDKNLEDHFKKNYGDYFKGFEEQKVKITTLNSVIEQNFNEEQRKNIDFISIDVEGTEVDVLCGLDFDKYGPRVLIVEMNKPEEVISYLKQYNYLDVIRTGCNAIFVRNEHDEKMMGKVMSLGEFPELTKVVHPLGWD